mmetsp:Transcript_9826/g.24493  ORF Transcript_9826/g.24493 Transcript_9826/m.24493 type:complete len:217 (+) Transcript_9826:1666-2316(+)
MQEGRLGGLGNLADQRNDRIDNRLFEIESALFSQKVGHESYQNTVLCGVGKAQLLETSDDGDLEFVRNFRQKGRNLFQEAVDGIFRTRLQKRGNGKRRDGTIGISDECLEVFVAPGDNTGLRVGDHGEGSHGCVPRSRLGRTQKELEDRNGRAQVLWLHARQRADGSCGLVDNHFGFVSKGSLEELVSLLGGRGSVSLASAILGFVAQKLGGVSNK